MNLPEIHQGAGLAKPQRRVRERLASALPWLVLFAVLSSSHAGPLTSADYTVPTDTTDAGGTRATSAAYTNDGSLGGVTGISPAAPAQTVKSGYIGQLFEAAALQLAATASTVNEGGTRQLSGTQLFDDGSPLSVSAGSITWSVQSGPLTGVDANGLATAGLVYQDTAAVAQGDLGGVTGTLNLTVLDTLADNFGGYAGDGLGDDWQVLHFGEPPNENAAPAVDFDHDGQDNKFEFIANLDPTDAASRFTHRIEPVPGQPGQKNIVFGPVFGSRSYSILTNPTLNPANWQPLTTGSPPIDNGNERTITDTDATGDGKFYQLQIVKP